MVENENENGNGELPATDRQRSYIRFLVRTAELSKAEASKLIDSLKGKVTQDESPEMQDVQ